MVVRNFETLSNAFCTIPSEWASKALVASSSRSIRGFEIILLAMAILCFCPPDNKPALSPTCV